jgi:hypothetical protein
MKKANLLCPRERVFFKGLLVLRPSLPTEKNYQTDVESVEVDVLEEVGERALVLLPNLLSNGETRTAMVNVQYLI